MATFKNEQQMPVITCICMKTGYSAVHKYLDSVSVILRLKCRLSRAFQSILGRNYSPLYSPILGGQKLLHSRLQFAERHVF
uniref:Uncharacterized protein n=1 Tax=Anguilla anguilla TaxID=7936 RepID=A0A0E9X224_ANGAN